ncbi:MAG: hypothetical protein KBS60_01210 [Phascolarctobacterium sp.]|nr:hypothetical protein [Candidatus Phascolarctobacterium caballi]
MATQLLNYDNFTRLQHPKEKELSDYFKNQNIVLGEVQNDVESMKTGKADATNLTDHIEDEGNPHNVTAHQVGTLTASEIIEATGMLMRSTTYMVGDICKVSLLPNNFYVECTQAGTTSSTEPTYTPVLNSEVLDGTAKFKVYRYANTTELGFILRNTAYVVGDACFSVQLQHNMTLVCTQAGTTAGTEPTITNPVMGMVISDGTAKFTIKPTVAEYCNTQPTTTSTASPYKPVVCIENYYDEETGDWYRKYSDGFIEQGGRIAAGSDKQYTGTFLIPFSNINYQICYRGVARNSNTTATQWQWIEINAISTTSFWAKQINFYRDWYACGY